MDSKKLKQITNQLKKSFNNCDFIKADSADFQYVPAIIQNKSNKITSKSFSKLA